MHLFERDCSVQRRHQKVIEIAPAPNLDPELRERMCADAVRFATEIGYRNAGTVEFLLDPEGNYVFIEMNPRIQVEHTVTEEITDVDLVQSQMQIAAGATLADLGLSQETVTVRGAALQCRITTEDPANGFRPDTGKITTYRSPGGSGVRLDGGTTYTGAEVSAHFDSMLAKLTCRGRTFDKAVEKARRAVAEFRIRGVSTNIAFLQAVLDDPDFAAGRVTTSFIETHPQLLSARASGDRSSKLLTYLADVTVNQPHGPAPVHHRPGHQAAQHQARRPGTRRHPPAAAAPRPRGVRPPAARPGHRGRHRHHVPRRAPVVARDPGPHPRPGRGRRARGPHDATAVVPGGVGRCDVRRRVALPRRGPVGAAGPAAAGGAEHLPADAAARPQHGRLHAVPDRGHRGLRAGGRGDRHRRLPDLRRPQRRRADAARDRGRPRDRHDRRGGRALLHRRPVRTRTRSSTRSTTTSSSLRGSSTRARTSSRSRTWPGCCARRPRARW